MATNHEMTPSHEAPRINPVVVSILAVCMLWMTPNVVIALATVMRMWDIYYSIHLVYFWNTLVMPLPLMAAALLALRSEPAAAQQVQAFPSVAAYVSIPFLHRVLGWGLLVTGLVLISGRLWATQIEPRLIQIRHIEISSPAIREPLRILHISDFQSEGIGAHERHAVRLMQACQPHLIIHTGDLLQIADPDQRQRELIHLEELFQPIAAQVPMGIYTVQGDVDGPLLAEFRQGRGVMQLLESRGVQLFAPDGSPVFLYGLTLGQSRFAQQGAAVLEAWLHAVGQSHPGAFTIAAGHAPDYILATDTLPIDLCLAGHTHGGQVRIPFWGPLLWASAVPQNMARGFHEVGSTRINVSAGIGAEHIYGIPPIRFNCPPEMTLITVIPEDTGVQPVTRQESASL